jgi:2-methylcitrate dehydratase PrpD
VAGGLAVKEVTGARGLPQVELGARTSSPAVGRLTDFILHAQWQDFPERVRAIARLCFLDTLGAALAGTLAPATDIAAAFVAQDLSGEGATVISSGKQSSPAAAAFANGAAANAVDIDDCGAYTWGHPGAVVFSVALAVAESLEASGDVLLTALVVGYETAFRAGRCINADIARNEADPLLFHDFRACGSWGSVASAAVASHLLSLTPEQTRNALGIAEYWAPEVRMMRDIDHPGMVKHGIAMGAMVGVMAGQLAALGYTGPPSLLEHGEYAAWVGDAGDNYILPSGVFWKEWSCCAWTHPTLQALRELKRTNEFSAEQIERIHVTGHHYAKRLGVRLPSTTEEAQFNLAWPIAVFLVDGEIGPRQILDERLSDAVVRELAARVHVTESERLTRLYSGSESCEPGTFDAAEVDIALRDGRVLRSGEVRGPSYSADSWSRQQVEAKFRRLVEDVLAPRAAEEVIEMVWNLERLPDTKDLVRAICEGRLAAGREGEGG